MSPEQWEDKRALFWGRTSLPYLNIFVQRSSEKHFAALNVQESSPTPEFCLLKHYHNQELFALYFRKFGSAATVQECWQLPCSREAQTFHLPCASAARDARSRRSWPGRRAAPSPSYLSVPARHLPVGAIRSSSHFSFRFSQGMLFFFFFFLSRTWEKQLQASVKGGRQTGIMYYSICKSAPLSTEWVGISSYSSFFLKHSLDHEI